MGYVHEEFSYRLWDLIDNKIIRSRDVIFFKNQTIKDIKKKVKIKQIEEYPVNLEPVPLPITQNEGGVLPEDDEGGAGEDDANEPPIVEPHLKRSTRGRVKSQRCPSDEYVCRRRGLACAQVYCDRDTV